MTVIRLQNLEDPRLRVFSSYTDGELRDGRQMVGLARDVGLVPQALASGLFVAESKNVIERAMAAGCAPFALLVEECWEAAAAPLLQRLGMGSEAKAAREDTGRLFADVPVFVATRAQVEGLTGFQRTRGPLAAFLRPAPTPLEQLLAGARRVAVLEGITNYTNIGAIFRSAAALGMDAVLLDPACHDPLYRRASRVSMGTVFQVPWGRIPALAQDGGGLAQLAAAGFKTAALALADGAIPISDERLKGAERLALVLGNEEHGLSPATIAACQYTAIIPMAHGVDSLNVAAASAVAFWETRPQVPAVS